VHDIAALESAGRPGVFVASTEFAEAADAQSRALGFDPARVLVPHPIQDRTDDELRSLADAALGSLLAELTASAQAGEGPAR
jgi:hypothetical protein